MSKYKVTPDDYRSRKIKSAMSSKGLTNKSCAKKMGMRSDSSYSRMIHHISGARIRDVELMCSIIGLSIAELLEVRK